MASSSASDWGARKIQPSRMSQHLRRVSGRPPLGAIRIAATKVASAPDAGPPYGDPCRRSQAFRWQGVQPELSQSIQDVNKLVIFCALGRPRFYAFVAGFLRILMH